MSSNTLLVSIHLDALFLEQEETVLEAMADFSRLPFYDGKNKVDANADVAYVSEEIVSHPFRDQGLRLGRGVHLHWAMPDALSKGSSIGKRTIFPGLPDRWLVVRNGGDLDERKWIVESDYLFPEEWSPNGGKPQPISFPLPPCPKAGMYQPYRYMGRSVFLEEWHKGESGSHYLNALPKKYLDGLPLETRNAIPNEGLTVMGYGEPAFAAFYPNCHSVFGLHDDEVKTQAEFKKVHYEVIGWFNDPARDCLRSDIFQQVRAAVWDRKRREYAASGIELVPLGGSGDLAAWYDTLAKENVIPTNESRETWIATQQREAWHEALEHHFKWKLAADGNEKTGTIPAELSRTLFCATLQTADDVEFEADPARNDRSVRIAVGNTAGEALSAYLADRVEGDKALIEEQLEALDLGSQLEHRQLDIGPKFLEKRHNKGFRGYAAGWVWSVGLELDTDGEQGQQVSAHAQATLPAYLGHALNQLNVAQQNYDQARHEIASLRREVYHDWALYMHAARPPEWLTADYPDPAEVGLFIDKTGLKPLRRKLTATGSLTLERHDVGGHVTGATVPAYAPPDSLAAELAGRIRTVLAQLSEANRTLELLKEIDAAIGQLRASASELSASDYPNETPAEAAKAAEDSLRTRLQSFAEGVAVRCDTEDSLDTLRDRIYLAASTIPSEDRQRGFVAALEQLVKQFADKGSDRHRTAPMHYVLRHLDAPRYYRPNNPVILMEGAAVRPTERHGKDGAAHQEGKLECAYGPLDLPPRGFPRAVDSDLQKRSLKFTDLLTRVRNLRGEAADGADRIGHRRWKHQPWHPFLMDWQAEVEPLGDGGNRDPRLRAFATDFIARNYLLHESAVDLKPHTRYKADTQLADSGIFRGRSLLTDYAPRLLRDKLKAYLTKIDKARLVVLKDAYGELYGEDREKTRNKLNTYLKESGETRVEALYEKLLEHPAALLKALTDVHLPSGPLQEKLSGLLDKVAHVDRLRAVNELLDGTPNLLSQALDGLHETLLQRHQVLQLPIEDPVGFTDMQPLTEAVRRVTLGYNTTSPLRDNDFTPIRSGDLSLMRLRLVDTFGRVKTVLEPGSKKPIIISETLRNPDRPRVVSSPPRFVQAARINFRWLSAEHATGIDRDEPEMNAHPDFTPVCGWFVPNNFDNSLMVYDNRGEALGSIVKRDNKAAWEPAPGSDLPRWAIENPDSIRINRHLRKLVNTIVHVAGREPGFLDQFFNTINNALETIAPEDFSHHKSIALLLGRPIAVVRAMVDLELRGRPAFNQSMDTVWTDMRRAVEEPEDIAERDEKRGQFQLVGEEGRAFVRALRRRHIAGVRSAFERRNLRLSATSEIRITAVAPSEKAEDGHGHWRIQLPARDYVVLEEADAVRVFLETARTSDAFTRVRCPIRIGEYQQLNDGLVGYWTETVDDRDYHYENETFWAPQAAPRELIGSIEGDLLRRELDLRQLPQALRDKLEPAASSGQSAAVKVTIEKTGHSWLVEVGSAAYAVEWTGKEYAIFKLQDVPSSHIRVHLPGKPIHLQQSIDDPPQKLTMLVDPQGSVHAVSGILPTKSISIPPEQYAETLKKMEVTFLSTPVLTEHDSLRLPLAAEPGYRWSWLAPCDGGWSETDEINKIDTHAHFAAGQRIVEGWLKLRREEP